MKKIILFICLFVFILSPAVANDFTIENLNLRPAKSVFLPKGSFVKLTNLQEFSSKYTDEGDEVVLMSTYDVYMGETNLIPQRSKFYGHIEKIREPIQGTNAAIVVRVTKFITPEGIPYKINGYLSSSDGNMFLGGGITPPLYYVRMPHYTRWSLTKWRVGAAQYCETNTRQYGMHTTVKAGAEIIMVLQDNFDLVQ